MSALRFRFELMLTRLVRVVVRVLPMPVVRGIGRVLGGGVFLYVRESRNRDTIEKYGHGTPNDWIEKQLYTRCPISFPSGFG